MAIEKRRMQQRYGTYEQFQSHLQNILDHEFISVDSGDTTLEGTTKGLYFKFPGGNPVRIYTTNEMENYNKKFNYYSVASGGDLDNIKDTGFYNFAGVDGYSNIPDGQKRKIKGTLLVVNHKFTTSTDVWNIDQYWFSPTNEIFARTYSYNEQISSGSWTSWALIATDINNVVKDINVSLKKKEDISNKTSNIHFPSIDSYPNNKAVWDYVESKLTQPLSDITDLQNRTATLENKSITFNARITDMESGKENASNKKQTIDASSVSYPSNVAVKTYVANELKKPLSDLENLKAGKLDKTDFNSYKTATDKAIKDNADNINLLDTNKANLVQSNKNLFDMVAYLKLLSTIANSVTKGTLDSYNDNSFTITSNDTDCYTNLWSSVDKIKFTISVMPNTTYTLSWGCEGASGNVFIFNNATTTKMWQTTNVKKQLTFTTVEDTEFVTVRFGVANANQTATYSNIQLELGEVATDYIPCKIATGVKELDNKVDKLQKLNNTKFTALADEIISNNIKNTTNKASNVVITDSSNYNIINLVADNDNYNVSLYSKNLLNFKEFIKMLHTNTFVDKDSVTIEDNTISYDMTEGSYCGIYFKYNEFVKDSLLIDKSCVISLTVTVDKACTFNLLDENSNKSVSKVLEPDTENQISLPFTLNQSTKAITFYGRNITETTHIKLSNIMIELGSVATDYEDYKDMQSVTQDTDLSIVHTYYPTTTVVADSDFVLTYVTDTKHYIDNRFNEIATALVAHESEVN